MNKPVMKNATVIVLNDPASGVQGLLAISKDGAFHLAAPFGSLVTIELGALKTFFENFQGGDEARAAALTAIEEATQTPS